MFIAKYEIVPYYILYGHTLQLIVDRVGRERYYTDQCQYTEYNLAELHLMLCQ